MTKQVIAFNGPPGVGKDTAVNAAMRHVKEAHYGKHAKHMKMADPLKAAVHHLFGTFHSHHYYDLDINRKEKKTPHPLMFGMSPREAYIGLSEKAIKPWLGDDIFGRIACNRMHNSKDNLFLFSDGGFVDEWVPVIEYVDASNVAVVELSSTSCSWANDSRGYIGDEIRALYPDVQVTRLTNTISNDPFDKELFLTLVKGVVDKVLAGAY